MARLYVLSGPDLGKIHDLQGDGPWILGRSPQAEVTLKGKAISREHAKLERLEAGWAVSDLGSSNGTKVEGSKQAEAWIEDGAELTLGDVELRFRADAEEPAMDWDEDGEGDEPALADEIGLELDLDPDGALEGAADAGLELEGEWDDSAPAPTAALGASRQQKPVPAPASSPRAPEPNLSAAEIARAQLARQAAPRGSNRMAGGNRVLQYQAKAQRDGIAGADLAQLSLPLRLALYALGLAAFAGLAYGAYTLTAG